MTRSPAQGSAYKDLGRNGQIPTITVKAAYVLAHAIPTITVKAAYVLAHAHNAFAGAGICV
ncbi:alpha-galactosidase [Lacticaseibacillus rhamnosus]|nr:alpha-galactosidase [Lacticaseibacillus rhamnosus]